MEILVVFCTMFGIYCCLSLIRGACWWYILTAWLSYAGKAGAVLWWQAWLLGFAPIHPVIMLVAAVLTWVIQLFIS